MKKIAVLTVFIILSLSLLPAQQINSIVQDAVNRLASGLNTPLQVSISPVTMAGTNAPSEVSRLLYNLISANAKSNRNFQIIQPVPGVSAAQTGTISGTFTPKTDVLDVSLTASERGERRSSVQFSIPMADLQQLGISVEPENLSALPERERLFSGLSLPVEQPVRIQAWFNSDSMTYLHREALDITVMADRDCYFKVIRIDVNNQEQVIFPWDGEDNYLRANTAREVYVDTLYGPYGVETILVVASINQFVNIRQDYLSSPRLATAASIRSAIAGSSAARYDIAILKPHGVFSMPLPSDINKFVQTIMADVDKQYGIFFGNVRSGYYTVDNFRTSYRVAPSDNPDSVEYAFYYEEVWAGSLNMQTRGSTNHSFSFNKPDDMNKAFNSLKSEITKNNGSLSGDISSGNFRAPALLFFHVAGQYTVTDKVNVTITEKPPKIDNSFIEKEVIGFFTK
jgi:hypothetical protein